MTEDAWLRGTDPGTGSRVGPTIRLGNKQLRGIPAADRLLEIVCRAGGSRKGGPRLVAVVTTRLTLQVLSTPDADAGPGRVFTPCRCGVGQPGLQRGHVLDTGKVSSAVERLRHQPRKGRRVDVARVAADPAPSTRL
jgi:hypothetical protein